MGWWSYGNFVEQAAFYIGCCLFGIAIAAFARGTGSYFSRRSRRISSDDAFRKLEAKKHNEHLKLIGSFCNTLGAAVLGAAFIVPYIGNHASPDQVDMRWVLAGLALPFAGHIALRFMKSEG